MTAHPIQGTRTRTVVVAVATYRRNDELAALLPKLQAQSSGSGWETRLLVIDNDPAAGARDVVQRFSGMADYRHEPSPGIAAVRNRALREAGAADVLIFIDDDEVPGTDWLHHLLATYDSHGSAAVVGPVLSSFSQEMPEYVAAGRYFERLRWRTGTQVATAATNNLLLDLDTVREQGLSFDERFGLTGGSDTLFCLQLTRAGGVIVWCDEAFVYDEVPASRNTREWVTQRAYRSGNTWSRASLVVAGHGLGRELTRIRLIAQGAVRIVAGSLRWAFGKAAGRLADEARGMRTLKRGAGMVAGAANVIYSEYRRTGR